MEFLQKIRERGHKISVLLGKCQGLVNANLVDGNINFYFASKWDNLSGVTRTPYPILKNVSRYIKIADPDIVHVNSHLFLSSYRAVEASHLIGIPSVVTVHGVMAKRSLVLNVLQGIYLQTVARLLFERVSAVICLTKSDAESITSIVRDKHKISIVPNGVDTEFFKPASVKDSDLITWVGRFVPEKGLVCLLKAMQKVMKKYGDVKLVLIGDGPLKAELMDLTNKLRLSDKVRFLGAVDREEVARWLSKSSIFAFPSLKEGMPIALLEAMASGNAVVASNILGINEIVKNNQDGILFPPKNVSKLTYSLLMLLVDKKLREKLASNARKTVEEQCSWDIVLKKIECIYNSFC